MINYEADTSPFYKANKAYCEGLEEKLNTLHYAYSGFCNSYGYSIDARFQKNNLSCQLVYSKEQTTRGAEGILMKDASDYAGVELIMNGFQRIGKMEFGKNKMKRLLASKEFNEMVPTPFYFSSNITADKQKNKDVVNMLMKNEVGSFKFNHGKVQLKIHSPATDMFLLIDVLTKIII